MNKKMQEVYSEVYAILEMLGEEYKTKLPPELYDSIKKTRLETYKPNYDRNIDLNKQKIRKESLSIIALIHLKYWCDSDAEKEKLIYILKDNEKIWQEKYNFDKILQSRKQSLESNKTLDKELTVVKTEDSLIRRIIKKIKSFLGF